MTGRGEQTGGRSSSEEEYSGASESAEAQVIIPLTVSQAQQLSSSGNSAKAQRKVMRE